ncbi:hypothetical protein [Loktanella sp. S4079]|uniref:hypothetical protein n=1 Tax=Loktanella sp. S4079 TaxID=579483 RepID=UPI0005F9BB39|nr:hypothetical protein [Loktanella sp. S4079]KJZ18205.1 hypothetical protein TW80_14780 [Loktanella sp. S4079]
MKFFSYVSCLALLATPLPAEEIYDLIFKQGTLSDVTTGLTYDRETIVASNPDYGDRHSGDITLGFAPDDMAVLQFNKGEQYRNLGQFPATVGNPIIMYFVETVLRDVAHEAGGSPFYIRNRIKEALITPAPISDTTVAYQGDEFPAKRISFLPFEADPNRERMGVYGDLEMTFIMSEHVPGWYVTLAAVATDEAGTPGYSNVLNLLPEVQQ